MKENKTISFNFRAQQSFLGGRLEVFPWKVWAVAERVDHFVQDRVDIPVVKEVRKIDKGN